jgi:hypothetical protein
MYFVTTRTSAHADGSKIRVIAHADKRDTARRIAAEMQGTVRNQHELDKLIEAGRLAMQTVPGYVAPEVIPAPAPTTPTPASWIDMARDVKASAKRANTLGIKEKFLKRYTTPAQVLHDAASAYIDHVAANADKPLSKVMVVRWFASWKNEAGAKLQRRDVFALIRERADLNDLADATISTQFQLVRSGKLNK